MPFSLPYRLKTTPENVDAISKCGLTPFYQQTGRMIDPDYEYRPFDSTNAKTIESILLDIGQAYGQGVRDFIIHVWNGDELVITVESDIPVLRRTDMGYDVTVYDIMEDINQNLYNYERSLPYKDHLKYQPRPRS